MLRSILISVLLIVLNYSAFTQVYTSAQTRHRFAQINMGLDVQNSFGGKTKYFDSNNELQKLNLPATLSPRFLIGGTHFWGHADFYIAIPLYNPNIENSNQELQYLRGVETVFKCYPWRIEHRKFRPYFGVSVAPFYFEQANNNLEFPNGPDLNFTRYPLLGGFTWNHKSHLFELGLAWNYNHNQDYYITRLNKESISTPPIYFNLSYRYMLDTTISAERDWESGQTQKVTDQLASLGKLNNFYLGAGISSSFWLGESSYNTSDRPYIASYSTSIMPDFTLGYYLHNPDLNLALGYRSYGTSTNTYGAEQSLKRKSLLLETTKYLLDYHGFAPFLGPVVSYDKLSFTEVFEDQLLHELDNVGLAFGVTFGWDIRPNRIQTWLLRTNLRWFPHLNIAVEGDKEISFNSLEFNFIQLVIFPGRM